MRRHVSALLGRIQSVAETTSQTDTLRQVVRLAADLVDAHDVLVACCDEVGFTRVVRSTPDGLSEVAPDGVAQRAHALLCEAADHTSALPRELCHDELPELATVPVEHADELVPVLGVPMRVAGSSFGAVLLVRAPFAGAFTADDEAIATAIASQAAIALQHQLRMADAQQRSDRAESLRLDAEQMQREQADFLAVISHDIKAPLSAIYGFAETLIARRTVLPDDQQDAILGVISSQSQRANRLVNALLELARVEAGALPLARDRVSMRGVARDAVEAVSEPVELHDELGAEDAVVLGDAQRIEQVIVNLLTNAVRYGAAPYQLQLRRQPDHVTIDVVDHGPGVPSESQRHLFERFSPGAHHVGLGLAIVRAFSEAHGGGVEYVDTRSAGATFRVTLPLAR